MAKFHLRFPPGCSGQRGDAAALGSARRAGMAGGLRRARNRLGAEPWVSSPAPCAVADVKREKHKFSSFFFAPVQRIAPGLAPPASPSPGGVAGSPALPSKSCASGDRLAITSAQNGKISENRGRPQLLLSARSCKGKAVQG